MNFGKFDIVLLSTMSLAIVVMSFTFPALGLADDSNETAAGDIPEFNISSSQWDIAGGFPEEPGNVDSGVLTWNESLGGESDNRVWIHGRDTDSGTDTSVVNTGSEASPDVKVTLVKWVDGSDFETNATVTGEGQEFTLETGVLSTDVGDNVTVDYEVLTYENEGEDDFLVEVEFNIVEEEGGGWIERVPIIGGFVEAGSYVAGAVGYIASIILWFLLVLFELVLTGISILLSLMIYAANMLQWLTTTYLSVVSAVESPWGSVIILIPAIFLFAEFAKLGMIGVSLLPFT